jgi:hypothetical protein
MGKHRLKEHFAMIPSSVLESEACCALNHAAFRILVILASQFRGANNGALALTSRFAQRYGLGSNDTVYRSLGELCSCGLLVRTRRGMRSKRSFSLYALGWKPVDNLNGWPLDKPIDASKVVNEFGEQAVDWRTWTTGSVTGGDGGEIHTDSRECVAPIVGNDRARYAPMVQVRSVISAPTIGKTLISGSGGGGRASRRRSRAVRASA